MLNLLAGTSVVAAGLYLVALGAAAFLAPARVRAFLAGFASSARAHFLEMFIRLVVGAALVAVAPQMMFAGAFLIFGWVVVGTTIALCAVPWRLHRRFAQWAVPLATRNMPLFAVGSLAGGLILLAAVLLGPVVGRP
jgi:hypothetical protein